jgi:hypothetical protein
MVQINPSFNPRIRIRVHSPQIKIFYAEINFI